MKTDNQIDDMINEIAKASKEIIRLSNKLEKIANKSDNDSLLMVSEVLLTLSNCMEDPFVLSDLHTVCKMVTAKNIFESLDDETLKIVYDSLESED